MRPALVRIIVVLSVLLLLASCRRLGEERTVTGTVVRLDRAHRTLTVADGMGGRWNFRVDPDAGIDLDALHVGSAVRVSIARGTPPNMMSAADRVRKGDRIEPVR